MIRKLFSFKGRLGRSQYAINYFSGFAVFIGATGVAYYLSKLIGKDVSYTILVFATIPFFYFLLAQRVKRIHDTNESAWLLLISAVPYINIIFELYLFFGKGTNGDNKYGKDPKNRYEHINILH